MQGNRCPHRESRRQGARFACDATDNASVAKAFDFAEKNIRYGRSLRRQRRHGAARQGDRDARRRVSQADGARHGCRLLQLARGGQTHDRREQARLRSSRRPRSRPLSSSAISSPTTWRRPRWCSSPRASRSRSRGRTSASTRSRRAMSSPTSTAISCSRPRGRKAKEKLPLARYGEVDDLDGVFLLLASHASRWMTGSTIVIDGGHVLNVGN
jgi:hypothetical protein